MVINRNKIDSGRIKKSQEVLKLNPQIKKETKHLNIPELPEENDTHEEDI